jgi:superfamily II DNA helicase RecQ
MQRAFGFTPFAWQDDILCHLLKMASACHSVAPAPTFLCQPTGGGKSLVRDVFASGRGGVTWCIGPLLALGADQESKINKRSLSNNGKTFAIHLDEYRTESQLLGIWKELKEFTRQSELAVVMLTSPQILCNSETIRNIINNMVQSGTLQMLCVNEAHLFVQFGLFFREEFIQLRVLLFQTLLLNSTSKHTKIPVLFMTATANQTILSQLERITGYTFAKHNIFWPAAPQMLEPKVRITFRYTPMPMLALKKRLEPLYKADER